MISKNTNKFKRELSESLSSDIFFVDCNSNKIIYFGTDIPTIKHQEIVNANVVSKVIVKPLVIINILLKKYIDRNHKLKELIKAKNNVRIGNFILLNTSSVLCRLKFIVIICCLNGGTDYWR